MKKFLLLLFTVLLVSCSSQEVDDIQNDNLISFKLLKKGSTGEWQSWMDPEVLRSIESHLIDHKKEAVIDSLRNTYDFKTGELTPGAETFFKQLDFNADDSKNGGMMKSHGYLGSYRAHVSGLGWLPYVSLGEIAGTVGEKRQLEALMFKDFVKPPHLSDKAEAHVGGLGWMDPKDMVEGIVIGTVGQGRKIEAIKLNTYSRFVTYRVHVEEFGWLPWVTNGQVAGTTGQNLRMEAIQVENYY